MVSDEYLAGIFDGEGWISVQHKPFYIDHRAYTRMIVGMGMNRPEAVICMQQRFGGSVRRYGTMFQWYVCGANARAALLCFAAHCLIKKEQAELALLLIDLLIAGRIKGRRAAGSIVISPAEEASRIKLAQQITDLKKPPVYSDT